MSGIKYAKKMCATVIKSKDDTDGYLQFCSNPQRKAAVTWPAGDKYIFLVIQAMQRTSSKSLTTQDCSSPSLLKALRLQIKLHLPVQLLSKTTASSAQNHHCL